jgi:ferredoxin-NADP reductase
MEITAQHSQHQRAEELRLITDSANIASIEALDRDRTERVVERAAELLDVHGREEWAERVESGDADWDELISVIEDEERGHENLLTELSSLKDRYQRPFSSLMNVVVDMDEEFDFVPGQYATIRFENTPRPYSIASSPNEDHIEFCVRRVPHGRLTSKLFEDLSEGDRVTVRGPNGDFVLEEPSGRDMAFLATGTGVAPLRSMIKYSLEEGRDEYEGERRDLWLFLGASWKDDLAYREEFEELDDEHENFHFVPTCSREEYLSDWPGETDYVQQTLVKYLDKTIEGDLSDDLARYATEPANDIDATIHPDNLEVYACGVNAMVSTLADAARDLGVPEDHVQYEGYG